MLERRAWDQSFYKSATKNAPLQWKKEMKLALSAITQETELAFFNSMIRRWHYQKITLSKQEEQLELENLVHHYQEKEPIPNGTLRSKMEYFLAMSTYHFMKGRPL